MGEIDPQQFGELKATVAHFEESMDDLKAEMKKLAADLSKLAESVAALTKRLDKARNWWQLLVIQGAIISAAAAFGAWLWDHWPFRG